MSQINIDIKSNMPSQETWKGNDLLQVLNTLLSTHFTSLSDAIESVGGIVISPPTIDSVTENINNYQIDISFSAPQAQLGLFHTCKVGLIGTSTLNGYGTPAGTESWNILQDFLSKSCLNGTLVNYAEGLNTSYAALPVGWSNTSGFPVEADNSITTAINDGCNIIVIHEPYNDISNSIALENSKENLRIISGYARSHGVEIIVVGPQGKSYADAQDKADFWAWNRWLKQEFQGRYIDLLSKTGTATNFGDDVSQTTQYWGDGSHLNIIGQLLLGNLYTDMVYDIMLEKCSIAYLQLDKKVNEGSFSELCKLYPNEFSFSDYNYSNGNIYTYRMKTISKNFAESSYSSEVNINLSSDLQAPQYTIVPNTDATDVSIDSSIIITFDETIYTDAQVLIDDSNVATYFGLKDSLNNPISCNIIVVGNIVTLTPSSNLNNNEVYTLSCTGVYDLAGNNTGVFSSSFTTAAVTSLTVSSIVVENATPNLITLTTSVSLDAAYQPSVSDFIVNVNSSPVNISSSIVTNSVLELTLESQIQNGDIITLDYTQGSTIITSIETTQLASFSNSPVTNNVSGTQSFTQIIKCDLTVDNYLLPWNQIANYGFYNIVAATAFNSLIDENETVTSVGLVVDSDLTLSSGIITGDNSGVFPDSVMNVAATKDDPSFLQEYTIMHLTGLTPSSQYTIDFHGGKDTTDVARNVRIGIGHNDLAYGTELDFGLLDCYQNTSNVLTLTCQSDADGTLYIGYDNDGDRYTYLSGFIVKKNS